LAGPSEAEQAYLRSLDGGGGLIVDSPREPLSRRVKAAAAANEFSAVLLVDHPAGRAALDEADGFLKKPVVHILVDRAAPWTEQLRTLLESLLTVLRTHPAAPELLLHSEKMNSEPALAATELTLDILRTAGFSPEDASFAARSTLWTGITLVMSEPGIESLDDAERTELQRKKQVTLATQSSAKYPRVVECALPMTACDNPEDHYKFGVDLFIGGMAAIAASRAAG